MTTGAQTPEALDRIWAVLGRCDADMFADASNARCEVFISRWVCKGSAGIDAIITAWPPGRLYACPPIVLLPRLFARLLCGTLCQQLVIIVPVWPAQAWWPVLRPDGVHSRSEVEAVVKLSKLDFTHAPECNPAFLVMPSWKFDAIALLWSPGRVGGPAFCLKASRGRFCAVCNP